VFSTAFWTRASCTKAWEHRCRNVLAMSWRGSACSSALTTGEQEGRASARAHAGVFAIAPILPSRPPLLFPVISALVGVNPHVRREIYLFVRFCVRAYVRGHSPSRPPPARQSFDPPTCPRDQTAFLPASLPPSFPPSPDLLPPCLPAFLPPCLPAAVHVCTREPKVPSFMLASATIRAADR